MRRSRIWRSFVVLRFATATQDDGGLCAGSALSRPVQRGGSADPAAARRDKLQRQAMKKVSALAVLDFDNIPTGVFAVDTILKKAPIAFVRAGTVTRGRYLVLFGGSTAATAESLAEARERCAGAILDEAFLPDVHVSLFDGVFGTKKKATGSLLII